MNTEIRPADLSRHGSGAEDAMRAGRFRDAQRHARAAIAAAPASHHGYYLLARACLALHDYDEGERAAQKAVELCPGDEAVLLLYGQLLRCSDRLNAATQIFKCCVDLYPRKLEGWVEYANALHGVSRFEEARLAALMALSIAPDNVAALLSYGKALKETGDPELAIEAVLRAKALAPDAIEVRHLLVFLMLMSEQATALDLRRESEEAAHVVARSRHLPRPAAPVSVRAPDHRIRLGVLSSDIHRHACAYFLIPLIANLDRARVEVVVFALNGYRDQVSDRIAALAERFVDVAGKPEAAVVEAVRAEGLDALIDLGGYTAGSPLNYMVHGLAPVQLTWLGFPGGTGMKEIHYRISDAVADPPGFESHYTETLLRAPGTYATYAPLVGDPLRAYQPAYQVAPSPALRNGYVTFGSCNNLGKLTGRVLRLWQAVLERVPGSKLLVEAAGLDLAPVRESLLSRMMKTGISGDRVILVPRDSARQYLTYHDIDVVLDTFPFTGGTTTCDALWMGVPIVTLSGQAFHSRMSASLLTATGLEWLACTDEATYVEAAVQLAADVTQLNALRQVIRPRFEQSAAMDAGGFSRWLEGELHALVSQRREVGRLPGTDSDGMTYEGQWLSEAELGSRIARLLKQGDDGALKRLLEHLSAKWSKHWMVAFALAEQAQRDGNREAALELLMIAISLFPSCLPLYQLLAARLSAAGLEHGWVEDLVQDQFGAVPAASVVPDAALIFSLAGA